MKIAVPNMGSLRIVARGIFEPLGFEVILPPPMNKNTIAIGIKYAPEFACFPLKAVLGDFILASRMGAEYLLILGGNGPCRFGWYGVTLDTILHDLGYESRVLILDAPYEEWAKPAYKILGVLNHRLKVRDMLRAFFTGYLKLRLVEFAEELARRTRPYQLNIGDADKALKEAMKMIDKEFSLIRLRKMKKDIIDLFEGIPKDTSRDPVRIGIVGEIYMVTENALNLNIESKLGNMGALVDRSHVSIWNYVASNFRINFSYKKAIKKARKYLKYHAGGESIYSVGFTRIYAEEGFDGVVHIMPLGCMPEIVAQSVMNRIGKEYDLPMLEMTLDQHTSEAGLITRLEAFYDLLVRRKRHKRFKKSK